MRKAILVDDEQMARTVLRGILEENFAENIDIVAECKDVPEAVKAIHKHKPEVVFLDIEMPTYNGFDLLEFFEEGQIHFKIIFVTAYSEYSLQAFEISAVDYLLKPVRVEAVARALRKMENSPALPDENKHYQTLLENLQQPQDRKIILQTTDNVYIVSLSDIVYIEAEGSYCQFHTDTQGIILVSKRLAQFEYLEQMGGFFRTHRSYMVNLDKIQRIDKRNFTILMSNGKEVGLSQDKKNELLERLEKDK
jgi:two-component system LytT family response regulator